MSDYNAKCKNSLPIIFDDRMPVTNLTPKIVNRVNNNTEDLKNLYGETESLAEDVEGKVNAPSAAGTAGQVLTSDGEGGTVWAAVGSGEIVVDPTLTVSGAAADAKAVGDVLKADIAPAYSTSSTYAVGDYVLYNNALYRCTTAIATAEAWTAAHWTAVNVGGELTQYKQDISELEDQLKPLYGEMALSLVPNSYWPSQGASAGIPTAYTGWSRTNRISCVPGEVLYITTTVASSYNVFFNTDTDGDVNARLVLSVGENIVTVPNGAYYFGLSNTTAGMEATKVVKIISADNVADAASNAVSALSIASQNTVDIDGIERYVGLTSSNYVYPVTSLEVSSSSQRKTTASTAKTINAVTVNAGSGFMHNINYYKVAPSDADAVAENGWQSGETTFIKPEGYNYWYVRFKKSDNTDFTSSDVESLLANVIVILTAETIDVPKQTVYVSTSGSDGNDGSATSPFKTLQKAVDSGALVIRAAAGEYTGFRVVNRKTPLTIMLREMPSQYAISTPDVPKIKITTGIATLGYGVYATGCVSVELSDIWVDGVLGDCFRFNDVGSVKCERCYASGNEATDNSMGFRINNCNGTFNDCVAWDINKDGFNIHRYGNTEFINCVAHDCGDDGISHHDGCTGLILGGEYYNCYKGGVSSPYGGSKIDVHNVYIHDNTQYGIYSMSSDEMLKSAGRISNCAIKGNGSYDIIATYTDLIGWNNIYDTKSIGTQATFTEIS